LKEVRNLKIHFSTIIIFSPVKICASLLLAYLSMSKLRKYFMPQGNGKIVRKFTKTERRGKSNGLLREERRFTRRVNAQVAEER
jgi:hypothetical protein